MFIFPIVVILVIILLAANIRIVPQAHSFIVERLGAYKETWDVGLHIKVPFIERLSRFDDNKLRRLNKISQKTIFNKGQDEIIKERIIDKIRVQFRNTSEKYKEGLENIKCKLYKSEKIIISEENKIIDKKERYINQYNEAELNWVKSGALRFYNRNKPPINSATGLVIDK